MTYTLTVATVERFRRLLHSWDEEHMPLTPREIDALCDAARAHLWKSRVMRMAGQAAERVASWSLEKQDYAKRISGNPPIPGEGELTRAIRALYYAAHWTPDRPCDAEKLWTDVRDAAGFEKGQSPPALGDALMHPRGGIAYFGPPAPAEEDEGKPEHMQFGRQAAQLRLPANPSPDSANLVERLRETFGHDPEPDDVEGLLVQEAAAALEALRRECEVLKLALTDAMRERDALRKENVRVVEQMHENADNLNKARQEVERWRTEARIQHTRADKANK